MRAPAAAALVTIRAYRRYLSPLLGRHCRYLPSCSEYAAMAVEEWGLVHGGWLSARRVLRCHPWSRTGLDLPPRRQQGTDGVRRAV